jgi:SIR2-like protein
MRKESITLDKEGVRFNRYKQLLQALGDQFDLGVYTLNYDSAALAALPDAFTGFSATIYDGKRRFDPRAVHSPRAWDFVYHLHGSVHHSLDDPSGDNNPLVQEVVWLDDLSSPCFTDVEPNAGNYLDDRSESKSFRPTTLIVGGHKLDQLLVEPFQSLHAALLRHVHEADAIIIGGYGFRDEHVDRALRSRMRSGAIRPRVMILERKDDDEAPLISREDSWSWRLMKPLDIGRHEFRPNFHVLLRLKELKDAGGFEVADYRAAVWNNGFTEAYGRVTDIVAWLDGADDNVLVPR